VIVISAADIAAILVNVWLGTPEALKQWLIAQFPKSGGPMPVPVGEK
jgi:hypothetical protein